MAACAGEGRQGGGGAAELSTIVTPETLPAPGARPPPAVERMFRRRYAVDVGNQPGHHHYVYAHPNGLCVVGLTAANTLLQALLAKNGNNGDNDHNHKYNNNNSLKVDFNVGRGGKGGGNRAERVPAGKSKRAAQRLEPNSALCQIVVNGSDGSNNSNSASLIVRSCVSGVLLEVNERLVSEPSLLARAPETEGFVAIIMPHRSFDALGDKRLISHEQYEAFLQTDTRDKGPCGAMLNSEMKTTPDAG